MVNFKWNFLFCTYRVFPRGRRSSVMRQEVQLPDVLTSSLLKTSQREKKWSTPRLAVSWPSMPEVSGSSRRPWQAVARAANGSRTKPVGITSRETHSLNHWRTVRRWRRTITNYGETADGLSQRATIDPQRRWNTFGMLDVYMHSHAAMTIETIFYTDINGRWTAKRGAPKFCHRITTKRGVLRQNRLHFCNQELKIYKRRIFSNFLEYFYKFKGGTFSKIMKNTYKYFKKNWKIITICF